AKLFQAGMVSNYLYSELEAPVIAARLNGERTSHTPDKLPRRSEYTQFSSLELRLLQLGSGARLSLNCLFERQQLWNAGNVHQSCCALFKLLIAWD
ncbi:MAG: hypothetical protein OT478_26670, partial [Cyanobacteria bacterium FC1]|nr:hypothetical protein [Cyanobacteria bacterium FC1]